MEVAECANARKIDKEIVFYWWGFCLLKNREVMTSQVTSSVRRITHKNGIKVPASLKHVAEIDSRNKNTFWRDTIAKEMKSIHISFHTLETGKVTPIGHNRTSGHMPFDVKIDFTRKARWVLDRHRNPLPEGFARDGVAFRESVILTFTCVALNNAHIWTCSIQSA